MKKSVSIIAGNIRRLRHERELTQRKFGDVIGVEQQTVHLWENGKRDVGGKYLDILREKFDVPLSYFSFDPEHDESLRGLPQEFVALLNDSKILSHEKIELATNFLQFIIKEDHGNTYR